LRPWNSWPRRIWDSCALPSLNLLTARSPRSTLPRPQKNHLSGLKRKYLKVSFATTQELMDCRRELMPLIARNKAASEAEVRAHASWFVWHVAVLTGCATGRVRRSDG